MCQFEGMTVHAFTPAVLAINEESIRGNDCARVHTCRGRHQRGVNSWEWLCTRSHLPWSPATRSQFEGMTVHAFTAAVVAIIEESIRGNDCARVHNSRTRHQRAVNSRE